MQNKPVTTPNSKNIKTIRKAILLANNLFQEHEKRLMGRTNDVPMPDELVDALMALDALEKELK